jgi:hypothetical protein
MGAVCGTIFYFHAVGYMAFIKPTSIIGGSGWSMFALDSQLNEGDWEH